MLLFIQHIILYMLNNSICLGVAGGGGVMSYIPGTEANRQSRAEHGQDPDTYRSGNQGYTGTGSNRGVGNTGGGVASYVPGTQANRESRAMHGQDPNTYSSGNNQGYGTGSNQGYSNTGGGVASYIPGTQANRESRAMHGQDPNTYSSGNTGRFKLSSPITETLTSLGTLYQSLFHIYCIEDCVHCIYVQPLCEYILETKTCCVVGCVLHLHLVAVKLFLVLKHM